MNLFMHPTTFEYILDQIIAGERPNIMSTYNGRDFSFAGYKIVQSTELSPTINEGDGWIFPETKFITYGPEDESHCRYCGIGRQGRGFVMGDIFEIESPFNISFTAPRTVFAKKSNTFEYYPVKHLT